MELLTFKYKNNWSKSFQNRIKRLGPLLKNVNCKPHYYTKLGCPI
jgi:hypothetical protein